MLGASFEQKSKSVLVAAFGSILLMMILVVGMSYNRMNSNYQRLSSGFENQYELINTLIRLRHIAHERIVMALLIVEESDMLDRFDKIEYFSDLATEFLQIISGIENSDIPEVQKQAFREALKKFSQRASMLSTVVDMAEDERLDEARRLIDKDTKTLQAGLTKAIDDLIEIFKSDINHLFIRSKEKNSLTLVFTLALVGFSLLLAGFVAAFVIRYINKTERALHLEKENALVTLRSIEDGVIRTDADNNIIYLNPSAETILGRHSSDLAGSPVCDAITMYNGVSNEPIVKPFEEGACFSAMNDTKLDTYLRRSDREKIWVDNTITPIRNANNATMGHVLVIRDITENHNAKQQLLSLNRDLEELNVNLESRVQMRTSELENANAELQSTVETLSDTQDKLVHSEKMASLGGLVAGISHEINTPLGVAVTSASSLHEETSGMQRKMDAKTMKRSDLNAYMEHAQQACEILLQNLSRASNMIRSFKQVAVDQSSDDWRMINLREYVDEILMSLRPKLKNRKISVVNNCRPDMNLYTNPGAIYQILSNFILNSLIHAFDEESENGEISISAHQENGMVILEYSDDGKGVPEDIQRHIFDPFFTTKRGQGGSGLGLNIVYNLINSTLNGRVDLFSEPNNGTRFITAFPVQYEREVS